MNSGTGIEEEAQHVESGRRRQDTEKVADGKLAAIQSMLKQIRNGTPLYRVQLPICFQEPRSLLERYSDFCAHLDLVINLPDGATSEQRFLEVLKFYISGWHTRQQKEVKNPFNPILGETYTCYYEHKDSVTQYIAEQISHHPPSTAFCIINTKKGVALNAYLKPSFRFRGNSLDTLLHGTLLGMDLIHGEEYEVTFPRIVIRGLLLGSMQIIICGPARVTCPQSGYTAELDFKAKGIFKGKDNYVVAHVRHNSDKKILYTVEGKWDDVVMITNHTTNEQKVFFDVHNSPVSKQLVPPLHEQEENESQRVWHKVVQGILNKKEDLALSEKTKVEDHQRALERERKRLGITWTPKHFCKINDDFYLHKKLFELRQPRSKTNNQGNVCEIPQEGKLYTSTTEPQINAARLPVEPLNLV